jgi:hypothetical protein
MGTEQPKPLREGRTEDTRGRNGPLDSSHFQDGQNSPVRTGPIAGPRNQTPPPAPPRKK